MIKELTIKNFRSFREATLELGRFTVLNGANNSGKSSVLYALQVLKNVVTDPSRSMDELLNLGFLSLGGLENTVLGKNSDLGIELGITAIEGNNYISKYFITLAKYGNYLKVVGVKPYRFETELSVSFPYLLNKSSNILLDLNKVSTTLKWNGHTIIHADILNDDNAGQSVNLRHEADIPIISLFATDVIPTKRGFSKPVFNLAPVNPDNRIYSEDEIATLIVTDIYHKDKIIKYFNKITGNILSVKNPQGAGFFYLQIREPDTPFTTELVNQGMGVNQILFLLAKILYDKNRLICIDEPEIHLHPTLIEQFVKVLVEIAEKEDKQFIFSTHSEHWLMSMLAEVNDGNIKSDDLKVYYLTKEGQETKVENQQVHQNGQIEGGLKNFLEAQMHLANRFFAPETA